MAHFSILSKNIDRRRVRRRISPFLLLIKSALPSRKQSSFIFRRRSFCAFREHPYHPANKHNPCQSAYKRPLPSSLCLCHPANAETNSYCHSVPVRELIREKRMEAAARCFGTLPRFGSLRGKSKERGKRRKGRRKENKHRNKT